MQSERCLAGVEGAQEPQSRLVIHQGHARLVHKDGRRDAEDVLGVRRDGA